MIVAGDHSNNEMAGADKDSWKSTFEDAGYQVETVLRGLGEIQAIRDIFTEQSQEAIASLN